jgi:very-short-patch-repair endonuclease
VDVFGLRDHLVCDYESYTRSFLEPKDERIRDLVNKELAAGLLWPEALVQLNPAFEPGGTVEELVSSGLLHPTCAQMFRRDKDKVPGGRDLRLHRHQVQAIEAARRGDNYVLTTGTGSGKSLAYIVPIVDSVLRTPGPGIKAIVVYPMNALANSQEGELAKFLRLGFPDGKGPVTFSKYTGQEPADVREAIIAEPPDIFLTNYVMLELILTRPRERRLIEAAGNLRFVVLDEMHTYRGRQGADVALLVRRLREATGSKGIQCVGTSATLAGAGTFQQQRQQVAEVASTIFGATVPAGAVIGETLRPATRSPSDAPTQWRNAAVARIRGEVAAPRDVADFVVDPLATWIESTFGLVEDETEHRLVRAKPRPIVGAGGAAEELARATDEPLESCVQAIRDTLALGYKLHDPDTDFPIFAFRLHQFFARGDAFYGTVQPVAERHITTQPQRFDPTDDKRQRVLLPMAVCRECGHEYYTVTRGPGQPGRYEPRELGDLTKEEDVEKGFLFLDELDSWPADGEELLDRLPEDWIEEGPNGRRRVKSAYRDRQPYVVTVGDDGTIGAPSGVMVAFVPAPLRFCLSCGVTYSASQSRDNGKLATLGSGGRSSATSLLSLTAMLHLRESRDLPRHAQKLLAFTDNRQDASLQAGHFNDFVGVGLLRAGLHQAALAAAGEGGLAHDNLTDRVAQALSLDLDEYAQDPSVGFQARKETDRALRDLLGYRLYRDLERGWRVTAPNLEQTGLLEIRYESLDELAAADEVWRDLDPALAAASADVREEAGRVLLDNLRRGLAIQVDYLESTWQDRLRLRSNQYLLSPWAVDEEERLEYAAVAYPRSVGQGDWEGNLFMSGRSGVGMYVSRRFSPAGRKLRTEEREHIIQALLEGLRHAGLVALVRPPANVSGIGGYQVKAAGMRWVGHVPADPFPFWDPIRVPRQPVGGHRQNPFFAGFYSDTAARIRGINAKEHTAQVPQAERIAREAAFREGRLPILFCSPTMELGVDISELNVVGLRNVPPTPANYAQRSGRAGRSGTPALVFSYCASGSPHDQYFFRRPHLMVSGQVRAPKLDLANEDLVRSHVHAAWLAQTGVDLKTSLADILELSGEPPALTLKESIRDAIKNDAAGLRAASAARAVLDSVGGVTAASWYTDRWLDEVLTAAPMAFDTACDRWRDLYRSAWETQFKQNKLAIDHSRPEIERKKAAQLRDQAEAQMRLLTGDSDESSIQSDFYSYRYFASEGFLPGYSFPRLPLSAWIPGRRRGTGHNDYLSRPRFLAISEFGPRSIVYHEGSRYRINQVMLPAERADNDRLLTEKAKRCTTCGYLHPIAGDAPGPDLCEHCGAQLPSAIDKLFRLRNVVTKRQDRITSDEEERQHRGYEIWTSVRFATHAGMEAAEKASVTSRDQPLLELTYGPSATIWRVNVGWRRRARQERLGFVLDTERGYWQKDETDPDDPEDAMSHSRELVIPYVEDTRNVMLLSPSRSLTQAEMASFGAALKVAIQAEFQLEDSELAVEPLPDEEDRRALLLYEAAEGGAGVLRRIAQEPDALSRVARMALRLCHFDESSGKDLLCAEGAHEPCAAACYDCLMSYTNQRDHGLLDRFAIKDLLLDMAGAITQVSSSYKTRDEHHQALLRAAESELERNWLRTMEAAGYRLPTGSQNYLEAANARPDFLYANEFVAVFVDGPPHRYPEVQERDAAAQARLEDAGYYVLRFPESPDAWPALFAANPNIFGKST